MQTRVGTFTAPAATGNQLVSWSTGGNWPASATPELILLWSSGQTAAGVGASAASSIGAFNATQQLTFASFADGPALTGANTIATSNTGQSARTTACIVLLSNGTPTVLAVAAPGATRFQSNGFNLNWTTVGAGTSGVIFGYMAFSGLTGTWLGAQRSPTTTGAQTLTGLGTGPYDAAIFVPSWHSTAAGVLTDGTTEQTFARSGIGFAANTAGGIQQFANMYHDNDGENTMDLTLGQSASLCMIQPANATNATATPPQASVTAFTSDGLTLNWSNVSTTTNKAFLLILIKGIAANVGVTTMPSVTTANTDVQVTGLSSTPRALLTTTSGQTTDAILTASLPDNATAEWAFGGSDGTTHAALTNFDQDAAADSEARRVWTSTAILSPYKYTAASPAAGSSPTANASAGSAVLQATGSGTFTLRWNGQDATQRRIGYLTFCDPALPQAPNAPTSPTTTSTGCAGFVASWTASATDATHDAATGYLLDVSTDNFSTFVTGYNGLNVGTLTTYGIGGLSASTTYQWRVRATNSAGTSANASPASNPTTSTAPGDSYGAAVGGTAGLIGYWRLGEASGSAVDTALGRSVSAGTSVTQGSASLLASTADTAYTYDGSNFTTLPTDAYEFTGVDPYSIEFWFKPSVYDTTYRRIAQKGGQASLGGWSIVYQSASGIYASRWEGSGTATERSTSHYPAASVVTGTTYHVVATYDGSTWRLYVNGSEVTPGVSTTTALMSSAASSAQMGGGTGGSMVGALDEVAFYNVALSSTTISSHYTTGTSAGGTTAALAGSSAGVSTAGASALNETNTLAGASAGTSTASAPRLTEPQALVGATAGTSTVGGTAVNEAQPLAGASAGTSSTGATTINEAQALAGASAGTSVAGATALTEPHALAGTSAGTSTATATRLTEPQVLAGSSAGTSSTTADLTAPGAPSSLYGTATYGSGTYAAASAALLAGTAAGTSAAAATALTEPQALTGSSAGTSTAGATALTEPHALAGATAGTSTAGASALVEPGAVLAGSAAGTATAGTPALSETNTLAGSSAGLSTAGATALRQAQPLAGASAGTSTTTADLSPAGAAGALAGSSAGTSTVAATSLRQTQPLAAASAGTSTSAATVINKAQPLAGTVAGASAAGATGLSLQHALAGSTAGSSTSAATRLMLAHALLAAANGTSTAGATLRLPHALLGAVAGTSTAAGAFAALVPPLAYPLGVTVASRSTHGTLTDAGVRHATLTGGSTGVKLG
jgi:hypothetical protein